ncbi:MAG: tyrosine-type recombinase/integrase [Candidatus Thorarchaeota archaeon]
MTQASNKQAPLEVWYKERTRHSRLKGKEYKTWNKDKRVLELYCEYRGLTPKEVLTEAQQDLDVSYDKLSEYFMYLTKTRKPEPLSHNAGITYFAINRSFLTYNGIVFTKKHMTPSKTKPKVRQTYRKLPLWGKDKRLDGNFRIWLDGMSKVHRSIALCVLSSGQKARMILRLNVDFVTEQPEDRLNLWLDTERIKTGEDVITFFTKEATRRLREYVKVHRKEAKPSDPLFVNERGERMNVAALQSAFRRATDKLFGKTVKDNPLTSTRLRHLFESACRKARLDPDIKKLFMGHKTSISGEYNTDNIDDLLEEYLRVEPYLTIYEGTTSAEIEADIEQLKENLTHMISEYQRLEQSHNDLVNQFNTKLNLSQEEIQDGIVTLIHRVNDLMLLPTEDLFEVADKWQKHVGKKATELYRKEYLKARKDGYEVALFEDLILEKKKGKESKKSKKSNPD